MISWQKVTVAISALSWSASAFGRHSIYAFDYMSLPTNHLHKGIRAFRFYVSSGCTYRSIIAQRIWPKLSWPGSGQLATASGCLSSWDFREQAKSPPKIGTSRRPSLIERVTVTVALLVTIVPVKISCFPSQNRIMFQSEFAMQTSPCSPVTPLTSSTGLLFGRSLCAL